MVDDSRTNNIRKKNKSSMTVSLGSWFQGSTVHVTWLFSFDSLTACMMVTVTAVSFCVHLYSLGYMQNDPHLPRFMSYLSLFTGGMLVLVAANDLVTLLVGWELIGVCSYLLIGFWFHRLSATKAAMKAVLVNRVSDTALLVGLMGFWWYLGSTDLSLLVATSTSASYTDFLCAMILAGALGKSAQIGLHVWLADAMEGPTPVSALIHAATLVTAGVYLIARTSSVWECSVWGRSALVWVGALTSLMAATMGLVQTDLKRVIAYSTCSQLGYMMVALGLSHYGLAVYHLMTHACFKALLFLGAGVAIHATADVQDLRRQAGGGAHQALPFTWACLLLGSLSLMGWPFLAGYYSKDGILELAWATQGAEGVYSHFILMAVAAFTSAYSFKVLLASFVFAPNARKLEISHPGLPYTMWIPLVILALMSVLAGYGFSDALIGWGTSFWNISLQGTPSNLEAVSSHMIPLWVAWLPFATAFIGLGLAYSYAWPMPWCAEAFQKSLVLFLQSRWLFDQVWNQCVAAPVLNLGVYTWKSLDKGFLEVLGPRGLTQAVSEWAVPSLKKWQSGAVQDYALMALENIDQGLDNF
uniref:NADH dehydrogenase subunit 5 n=1 Tax=Monoraphidium dybowskii TaxID=81818 RepID=UPI0022FD6EBD|nr:NADH dehydrogenase subunit 5 [Monoraphidium dybowskii]WBP66179.1 NADH dehydrogenase subunit 5 [Chlorolobion braunii]